MTRTITFAGVRGGHGTSTVAAVVALYAARHTPTVLVSPDTQAACALLGTPSTEGPRVEVAPGLALAGERPDPAEDRLVVVDEGTIAAKPPDCPTATEEHYRVLRGPCYVALATTLAADIDGIEGIVLVAERDRSLRACDVTDVLGIPVVATVTLSPQVARTIDAGLLPSRFTRLRDLDELRALATPLATATAAPRRPAPRQHTDLPLSLCDNGVERASCPDRVALFGPRPLVGRMWEPSRGRCRVEHRPARPRGRRLLRRRGRHLGRGLLLGPRRVRRPLGRLAQRRHWPRGGSGARAVPSGAGW
jgi:hypothetical protein